MFVTWSALELSEPSRSSPWLPTGAAHVQAGQAGRGRAELPVFDGLWWSVLAVWDQAPPVQDWPVEGAGLRAVWHVLLEPVSYRGDAWLSGGARPFEALPARGKVAGAAAVITLAGLGADPERGQEFFERFVALGKDVATAPGNRVALVQAAEDGAQPTFSGWESLRHAVTWAYHRPEHAETVRRQEERALADQSGFLRCAVVASRGTLHGTDPLAGLTGTPVAPQEAA